MSGSRKRRIVVSLLGIVALFTLGLLISARQKLGERVDFAATDYAGSDSCRDCHADRHESWHRTFHRTMTQDLASERVLGEFDGRRLAAFGGATRPVRDAQGYAFEYFDPVDDSPLVRLPVGRLVGSHRYQQYLTRDAGSETWYRLHWLWHVEEQRWVHMNAAFLGSDAQGFDAQVTTWNVNCVNCHNTGPEPRASNIAEIRERARRGEVFDVRAEMRFDTRVAELGIGCEACHGPGSVHVERMAAPALRWTARLFEGADRSIVNPERLAPERVNDLCGACHAGRTLANVAALDRWMERGPGFRPGDELRRHVVPLHTDTPSPSAHAPDLFRNRFWLDGSVRLTAYEYQGLNASECARAGLDCIDCHTMHGGDPAGMLPQANRGDAPCLRCHQELRTRIAEHSGHRAESAGARCMACHMPRAVYGVMDIHRSHHISVPDVGASLAAGKPDACLNCHVSEAPAFAVRPESGTALPMVREDGAGLALADGLVALLAGDPVRQAVAAYELGRVEQAPSKAELPIRAAWLIAALDDDRPAVRRFAWRSLRSIDAAQALGLASALAGFDYTGEPASRARAVAAITAAFERVDKSGWPTPPARTALDSNWRLDAATRRELEMLGARTDKQIDIGE